jgi:hypothetical protein
MEVAVREATLGSYAGYEVVSFVIDALRSGLIFDEPLAPTTHPED